MEIQSKVLNSFKSFEVTESSSNEYKSKSLIARDVVNYKQRSEKIMISLYILLSKLRELYPTLENDFLIFKCFLDN
jgi:hypothetical protein